MKFKKLFALYFVSLMLISIPVHAAGWKKDIYGWWWEYDDTSLPDANSWLWLDGNGDGISECYYFDNDSYMLANTTTPDGYTVDSNGVWTVNGVVQTKVTGVPKQKSKVLAASSGRWISSPDGRWWRNDDGSYPVSQWLWIDDNSDGIYKRYCFDSDGYTWDKTVDIPEHFIIDKEGYWYENGGETQTMGSVSKLNSTGTATDNTGYIIDVDLDDGYSTASVDLDGDGIKDEIDFIVDDDDILTIEMNGKTYTAGNLTRGKGGLATIQLVGLNDEVFLYWNVAQSMYTVADGEKYFDNFAYVYRITDGEFGWDTMKGQFPENCDSGSGVMESGQDINHIKISKMFTALNFCEIYKCY